MIKANRLLVFTYDFLIFKTLAKKSNSTIFSFPDCALEKPTMTIRGLSSSQRKAEMGLRQYIKATDHLIVWVKFY